MLEWYQVIILSTQLSGIAKTADSFLGVVVSLNSMNLVTNFLLKFQFFFLQLLEMVIYAMLNTKRHP